MGNLHAFAPKASVEQNNVEIRPSEKYGPLFACLDDKDALKEHPHLAFKDVIFEACTTTDERNAYLVKRLRECLAPEAFKEWEIERRKRTEQKLAQQKQRQQTRKQAQPPETTSNPTKKVNGSSGLPKELEKPTDESWLDEYRHPKTGVLKATFLVLAVILRNAYEGRLSYNEMNKTYCFDGYAANDDDISAIREEIEREYDIEPGGEKLRSAFNLVCKENTFHPVRKYLESLPAWDGKPRIELIPREILKAPSEIAPLLIRKWLISAIARAMEPGCKVDTLLTLAGPQGALKSTFFRVLAGEWFSDDHMDLDNKDAVLQLHNAWIYEWPEIDRITSKKGASDIKAFTSKGQDKIRAPYGRGIETYMRSCVIVGTTNQMQFLRDETGSRRYWVVQVGKLIDVDLLKQQRDQLLAEALHYYRQNEKWWLTDEDEKLRADLTAQFEEQEPWEDLIAPWLKQFPTAQYHTTEAILSGALNLKDSKDHNRPNSQRVSYAMTKLGWRYASKRIDGRVRSAWLPPKDKTPSN